jgi:hypothetical protein
MKGWLSQIMEDKYQDTHSMKLSVTIHQCENTTNFIQYY